jgi:hypothetical protein
LLPSLLVAQTISTEEKADTVEMSYRSLGLPPSDLLLVEKSLQKISTPQYVYIVIHGENNVFKIWEGKNWKEISHKSLARWISENISYNNKTIVLLSCSNSQTTQALSNRLAQLDTTAKPRRNVRNVIGWDDATFIFENGFITGEGACRMFIPSTTKGNPPISRVLSACEMPRGVGFEPDETDFVMLGGEDLILMRLLKENDKKLFKWSMATLRREDKSLYLAMEAEILATPKIQELLQERKKTTLQKRLREIKAAIDKEVEAQKPDIKAPRLWDAWFYLKLRHQKSRYINDLEVLKATRMIMKEYFALPNAEAYRDVFDVFLNACLDIDASKLLKLTGQTTFAYFQAVAKKVSKGELLSNYLSTRSFDETLMKDPDDTKQQETFLEQFKRKPVTAPKLDKVVQTDIARIQNIAVWASSEPNIAVYMNETSQKWKTPKFPKKAFDALNVLLNEPYITTITNASEVTVDEVRKPLVHKINKILGENIANIVDLRNLTKKQGLITKTGSWGSIFEYWVREQFFVALDAPDDVKDANKTLLEVQKKRWNHGKVRFYLLLTKDKDGKVLERKAVLGDEITPDKRIIDCSYTEPNADDPTCTKVAVEIKHTQGRLESDPITQLQDNVKLVRAKKLKRIEYIFSTEATALANQALFLPAELATNASADDSEGFRASEREDLFRVFYIDDYGVKQIANYSKK